jgi:hypothetical protein
MPGVLDYSNGRLLCGLLSIDRNKLGFYKYLLKIRVPNVQYVYNPDDASAKGYYFKEGAAGELISLFSLYFQCRFFLVATNSGELTNHGLKIRTEYAPTMGSAMPLFDPEKTPGSAKRNFSIGLAAFLDRIKGIPAQYHHSLILSAAHYSKALREFGIDEEMLFIRLVSGIEAVSRWVHLGPRHDPLSAVNIDDILKKESLSTKQIEELRRIFDHRKASEKFITFVESHCTGFFKGGNYKARHIHIGRPELRKVLETVYRSRSEYLHNGETMYLSHPMISGARWDTDPTYGMTIDHRKFSVRQKLPYSNFFQRLVRHSLLSFMASLNGEGKKPNKSLQLSPQVVF